MWEYMSFIIEDPDAYKIDVIAKQLVEYLNKNNIRSFQVVQMLDDYLEIVYWVELED